MAGKRVNVAVCGIFHHRKYIGELSRRRWDGSVAGHGVQAGEGSAAGDVLSAFYFSHKRETDAMALGISAGRAYNCWAKEYLYRGMEKGLGTGVAASIGWLTHDLWQAQVLRRWERCDVLQLMLHGTGLKIMARARAEGSINLGEPVNAHPEVLHALLAEEHRKLGLVPLPPMDKATRRLVEEVGHSDALLVASGWMKRSFVEKGFAPERVIVQPFAADVKRFYPLGEAERAKVSDGKFRVICVAQLNARKGQVYLLEAWKRLGYSASEAELVIVGMPSMGIEAVLARYEGLFTYRPSIPHDELRMEFGRSSLLVLPSVEDGFGMVAVEAMAVGLPVITTTNAGVADVVENGRSGFVVPACSAEALAEKIDVLKQDPGLLASMGARSAELSRTTLSWSAYCDKLVEIYAGLLTANQTRKQGS